PTARSEHLPHQPEQAPALAGVERSTPRRLGQDFAEQPVPDGGALGGEHDVLAPPVPQGGFPPGQPVLLQGVRDRGDEGRVTGHPLAEFLHRHRGIELEQRDRVAAVHPELGRDALAELVEVLEELGKGVADLLVELVVGQRLGVRDRLSVQHRCLEYCPRALIHVAHLHPHLLADYLSSSIIEQLNYISARWCKASHLRAESPRAHPAQLLAASRRLYSQSAYTEAAAGGAGLLASCSPDSQTSTTGAGASRTASAAGTTPGGATSGAGAAAPTATPSPSLADWTALGRDLSGPLVRPGESAYTVSKRLFDPRFDSLHPAGIAYCRNPHDVATCLAFVRKFGLPVAARCGGHSYAGWSSTSGLIIDVTRMSGVNVSGSTATVGAGTRLIDFYNGLAA